MTLFLKYFAGSNRNRKLATHNRRPRLGLDRLEERVVLTTFLRPDASGILEIHQTDGDDTTFVSLEVDSQDTCVSENNQPFQCFAGVKRIRWFGYGGHDTFQTIDDVPVEAHGGEGNDSISGSTRADQLYGDGGHDTLSGGLGDDILYGGAGNDTLLGQGGSDRLWGEADSDQLDGGTENDFLYGGTGNDRLLGQSGYDELYGQDGNDYLDGGRFMLDRMVGGAGADRFVDDILITNNVDRALDFMASQGDAYVRRPAV